MYSPEAIGVPGFLQESLEKYKIRIHSFFNQRKNPVNPV
jgi:hypothetical protein